MEAQRGKLKEGIVGAVWSVITKSYISPVIA